MSGGWQAEREGAAHHDDEEIRHSGESRNPVSPLRELDSSPGFHPGDVLSPQ